MITHARQPTSTGAQVAQVVANIYERLDPQHTTVRALPANERAGLLEKIRQPLTELGNSPDERVALRNVFFYMEPERLADVFAAMAVKLDSVSKAWPIALDALDAKVHTALGKSPDIRELSRLDIAVDAATKTAGGHSGWTARLGNLSQQIFEAIDPLVTKRPPPALKDA